MNDFDLENEIASLEREIGSDPEIVELNDQVEHQAETNSAEWKTIFTQLLGPGFAILAPAWNVQKSEIEALSEAYAPVMAKYFPDVSQVGPEISAALVTAAVIVPRLSMPRKVENKNEASPAEVEKQPKKATQNKSNVTQLPSEEDR